MAPSSETLERGVGDLYEAENEYYPEGLPRRRISQRRGSQIRLRLPPRIISDIRVAPPSNLLDDRTNRNRGEMDSRTGPWNFHHPEERRGRYKINSESSVTPGTPFSVDPGMTDMEFEENREPPPLTYAEKLGVSRDPDRRRGVVDRPRKRFPRSAAIGIKLINADLSFADIIRRAKAEIFLADFGIADSRIRRTANGNLLIEVLGPESSGKADKLADRLCSMLKGSASVTRPVIRGDLRLTGLDESVSPQEIIDAVTREGECSASDIRLGQIVPLRSGLGRTWIRCPLHVADRIAQMGKIRIGWSSVRAESLGSGPVQCYKCWNFGHERDLQI